MGDLCRLIWCAVAGLFRSRAALQAEVLVLRRPILSSYAAYYNEVRTHLALDKDAPLGRAIQRSGTIVAIPILSGLHHHYVQM
jgi:hypothetical protein